MHGGQGDLDRRAERHAAAIRDAMRSVAKEARGLPVEVAAKRFERALRERDVWLPSKQLNLMARSLSDRWWHLKHPLKTRREILAPAVDEERPRLQRESRDVNAQVTEVVHAAGEHSWSFRARRWYDGMQYEVTLDGYTEDLARRIQEAVAPIPIRVRPTEGP